MIDQDEIVHTIELLQNAFEDLAVRGLRSVGSQQLQLLESLHEEMDRIGAAHMSERIKKIVDCIKADDPGSARSLMQAQASLRVFDRLITIEAAEYKLMVLANGGQLESNADDEDEDEDEASSN